LGTPGMMAAENMQLDSSEAAAVTAAVVVRVI
jgi:hypothetical protein